MHCNGSQSLFFNGNHISLPKTYENKIQCQISPEHFLEEGNKAQVLAKNQIRIPKESITNSKNICFL